MQQKASGSQRLYGTVLLLLSFALALSAVTSCATPRRGSDLARASAQGETASPTVQPATTSLSPTQEAAEEPATATASPSDTASPVSSATSMPTPSDTPTPTPTSTDTTTPTPTSTATLTFTPTPVVTVNPAGHVGLGAYLVDVPYDDFRSIVDLERVVHHKMTYALWFQAWGDDDRAFKAGAVAEAHRLGLTPVITWEPWHRDFAHPQDPQPAFSLASIASGAHDVYIIAWARAAREAQGPIIIRFAHEQSTEPTIRSWYPWQGDPTGYRDAFRHVVQVFRREGATNVRFLWSAVWLNSWADQYYPGEDVVDLVGTTVLNHGTGATVDWAKWRTFDELFEGQYNAALNWDKPIIISEMATASQGGDKIQWLRDTFGSLPTRYPLVEGVLLLEVRSDRDWPEIDWSVTSDEAVRAAFTESVNTPYYR